MSEVWLPSKEKSYATPSLILHYIEKHSYIPPNEFILALEDFDLDSKIIAQSSFDARLQEAVNKN